MIWFWKQAVQTAGYVDDTNPYTYSNAIETVLKSLQEIQWNLSKADTYGTEVLSALESVRLGEV